MSKPQYEAPEIIYASRSSYDKVNTESSINNTYKDWSINNMSIKKKDNSEYKKEVCEGIKASARRISNRYKNTYSDY